MRLLSPKRDFSFHYRSSNKTAGEKFLRRGPASAQTSATQARKSPKRSAVRNIERTVSRFGRKKPEGVDVNVAKDLIIGETDPGDVARAILLSWWSRLTSPEVAKNHHKTFVADIRRWGPGNLQSRLLLNQKHIVCCREAVFAPNEVGTFRNEKSRISIPCSVTNFIVTGRPGPICHPERRIDATVLLPCETKKYVPKVDRHRQAPRITGALG